MYPCISDGNYNFSNACYYTMDQFEKCIEQNESYQYLDKNASI